MAAAVAGFYTPGLGRSTRQDWTIEGGHLAERCQSFILIALGESIVVIGADAGAAGGGSPGSVAAFLVAFIGSVGFWWMYFDRSADKASEVIASRRILAGWAARRITSSTR